MSCILKYHIFFQLIMHEYRSKDCVREFCKNFGKYSATKMPLKVPWLSLGFFLLPALKSPPLPPDKRAAVFPPASILHRGGAMPLHIIPLLLFLLNPTSSLRTPLPMFLTHPPVFIYQVILEHLFTHAHSLLKTSRYQLYFVDNLTDCTRVCLWARVCPKKLCELRDLAQLGRAVLTWLFSDPEWRLPGRAKSGLGYSRVRTWNGAG